MSAQPGDERKRGAERVGAPQQRAHVAGIGHVPERQAHGLDSARQRVAPVDPDHARRVGQRRDASQQLRLDVLARDEQLDGLDPRLLCRAHEILALADEETLLLALPPGLEQATHEAELRVRRRGDHSCQSSHVAW